MNCVFLLSDANVVISVSSLWTDSELILLSPHSSSLHHHAPLQVSNHKRAFGRVFLGNQTASPHTIGKNQRSMNGVFV